MRRVASVLHLLGVRQIPAAEIQIFLAIIVLAIVFSYAFPDSFATSGTLLNMARVAGIMLVVSIGQSFALIVGGFDISVGATMGLVSVICALLMKHGFGVAEAVALGVLAGSTVGLINGIGISILGVTPFVMTLGHTHCRARPCGPVGKRTCDHRISPRICALRTCIVVGCAERRLHSRRVALVIAWFILQRTRAGLYIFAIGGSRETTRVAGVFVELVRGARLHPMWDHGWRWRYHVDVESRGGARQPRPGIRASFGRDSRYRRGSDWRRRRPPYRRRSRRHPRHCT